ncbi:hypothetical protein Pflav_081280 [Phytohabitans flavus]|uniref:Uncharacterized protein n=1 Tax=Phytohabitans flavus TaxID=1076124 RepID=A0A6F8Y6W1_9ACTN|nr:hypothetical protein Pflav_081280 [Phytohabitans flavus]
MQLAPFKVNDAGRPVLPVCVAWKPTPTEAFGAMLPLYETLRAVTWPLLGEYVAFQPDVIVCPLGSAKASVQPLTGALLVLVMVIDAVRPLFQALTV